MPCESVGYHSGPRNRFRQILRCFSEEHKNQGTICSYLFRKQLISVVSGNRKIWSCVKPCLVSAAQTKRVDKLAHSYPKLVALLGSEEIADEFPEEAAARKREKPLDARSPIRDPKKRKEVAFELQSLVPASKKQNPHKSPSSTSAPKGFFG